MQKYSKSGGPGFHSCNPEILSQNKDAYGDYRADSRFAEDGMDRQKDVQGDCVVKDVGGFDQGQWLAVGRRKSP